MYVATYHEYFIPIMRDGNYSNSEMSEEQGRNSETCRSMDKNLETVQEGLLDIWDQRTAARLQRWYENEREWRTEFTHEPWLQRCGDAAQ